MNWPYYLGGAILYNLIESRLFPDARGQGMAWFLTFAALNCIAIPLDQHYHWLVYFPLVSAVAFNVLRYLVVKNMGSMAVIEISFMEAWDYGGESSPAFDAIEARLIPVVDGQLKGDFDGHGQFMDDDKYDICFVVPKSRLQHAISVLAKELNLMGAPSSTMISVNGVDYPI